jgi:hypothetical protein
MVLFPLPAMLTSRSTLSSLGGRRAGPFPSNSFMPHCFCSHFSVLCWDSLQSESELAEYKKQAKLIFRKLNENSEERASIESGPYFLQYFPSPGLLSSLSSCPLPSPFPTPDPSFQYAYTNPATSSTRQSAT